MADDLVWYQKLRNGVNLLSTHANDRNAKSWNPTARYYLHVGTFRGTQQVTLIVKGGVYTFEDDEDHLGPRVAAGSLEKMRELFDLYVRML